MGASRRPPSAAKGRQRNLFDPGDVNLKKIAVITGSRAEYDRLYAPIKAIQNHAELDLQLIATGAHLSPNYGNTLQAIEKDGFPIAERIESLLDSSSLGSRAKSAGIQLMGLVQAFERLQPDLVLVFGDREEAVVAALACVYMNLACAHICGGDLAVGNVDDSVRHAITKLAHLHFPASSQSADRILRMGEEAWRVHLVGDPGLDRIHLVPVMDKKELGLQLGLDFEKSPVILLVQHPVSSEVDQAAAQMKTTLDALEELNWTTLIGSPNSDAGSRDMLQIIDAYAARCSFFHTYQNLDRFIFVNLLRHSAVLVGNSSMGIYEAPLLRLPAVNVGTRQTGREHAENILFVGYNKEEIKQAIQKALFDPAFKHRLQTGIQPFGDGQAGTRIAACLADMVIDRRLLVKHWAY